MQIRFVGVREWDAALDQLVVRKFQACRTGADRAALLVASETKQTLSRTTHKRGTPTPSRPGEPPSLITGTLRRSMKTVPAVPISESAWKSKAGPTAVYSRIQELGGDTGWSVLPPRPYLAPTLERLIANGSLWAIFKSGWEVF